jgi:hypothetical protein
LIHRGNGPASDDIHRMDPITQLKVLLSGMTKCNKTKLSQLPPHGLQETFSSISLHSTKSLHEKLFFIRGCSRRRATETFVISDSPGNHVLKAQKNLLLQECFHAQLSCPPCAPPLRNHFEAINKISTSANEEQKENLRKYFPFNSARHSCHAQTRTFFITSLLLASAGEG